MWSDLQIDEKVCWASQLRVYNSNRVRIRDTRKFCSRWGNSRIYKKFHNKHSSWYDDWNKRKSMTNQSNTLSNLVSEIVLLYEPVVAVQMAISSRVEVPSITSPRLETFNYHHVFLKEYTVAKHILPQAKSLVHQKILKHLPTVVH